MHLTLETAALRRAHIPSIFHSLAFFPGLSGFAVPAPAQIPQAVGQPVLLTREGITVNNEQTIYEELCYYTLTHSDSSFIHQHVVDAFAAQTSNENDKPIKLTFALVGLYLHVEKQFNGRQVQLAHMKLARVKQDWPVFSLPKDRGAVTAADVMTSPVGPERDEMIHQWCVSVWDAFGENRQVISNLLVKNKII